MPFTLAHPILPVLLKKAVPRLSLTALIAGSMIPDMENFFKLQETSSLAHGLLGLLLLDWPAALLLCFVFHLLLRNSFISNLPYYYRNRLAPMTEFDWTRYVLANKTAVFVSLLVGVLSHFGWDAFTHKDGFFVQLLPVLSLKIRLMDTAYPVFYLVQLISSVMGIWLLYRYIRQLPPQPASEQLVKPDRLYRLSFLCILIVLLVVRLLGWPDLNTYLGLWRAGMGALFYTWVIVSFIFYKRALPLSNVPM
jgi:Domain of unknown function (DUF4184)